MRSSASLFVLSLLCDAVSGFAVRRALPHTDTCAMARTRAIVCAEKPIAVSPAQGAAIAGGTLSIVGAAYCTSTGSPPTGLTVATGGLLFMYLAAGYLESTMPEAEAAAAVPTKPISVSPAQGAAIAGGTLSIVGAAYCTSTGSPPTGLAVATVGLLFMYLAAGFLESAEA